MFTIIFGYHEDPFYEGEEQFSSLADLQDFIERHEGDFSYYAVYDRHGNDVAI